MSAKRANFRVGQVVMVRNSHPFKILHRYFDGLWGQIVYENRDGEEQFESFLRPLTRREKEGKRG